MTVDPKPLPELARIESLLNTIIGSAGATAPALEVFLGRCHAEFDNRSTSTSYNSLQASISGISDIVREKFQEPGRRQVALNLIRILEEIFGVEAFQGTWADYQKRVRRDASSALNMMPLLQDLSFDSDRLLADRLSIIQQIEKLKSKIGIEENISDPAKTVLLAQLRLLEQSLEKFETTGVGPFRQSIFTVFGRVVLELEREENLSTAGKRELVDDVLRVYGLMQAGGDLLKLGGPVISGLLAAPT